MSAIRLFGGVLAVVLVLAPVSGATQVVRVVPDSDAAQVGRTAPAAAGSVTKNGGDNVASILIIDDVDITRPTFQRGTARLRDVLGARSSKRTLLRVESLDMHYPTSAARDQRKFARIADEYAQEPIDLLIANGDASIAVATRLREEWGRDIPIIGVYATSNRLNQTAKVPPLVNGVQVRLGDINRDLAHSMRALIPTLTEVLIVGPTDEEVEGAVASMRPVFGDRVWLDGIVAPTHDVLAQRFARLGPQSAIVYLVVDRDSQGRTWQPQQYLRRLYEIAPRPVFGWVATYLGLGIIGGPVLDGSEVGDELGRVAVEVLNGANPSAMQPVVIDPTRLVYDWEPLRRFGIPLSRLPDGATVLNRPLPVWESYPRTTIAVTALLAVMLVSLGTLMYSRQRVREANAAQLAATRRLLQAQDEERIRIARDLHDDLCQQMAMLAFDASGSRGASMAPSALVDRVHTLIDRTRRIAIGLHATHIGSMPFREAVSSHAASVQARTGLDIQVHVRSWDGEPPPPVALALFRAMQEALQNTVRHAEATQVTVSMEASNGTMCIEVVDDGIGFDRTLSRNVGLGLTSMRERMAMVGGACTVRSVPFGGTTVVLSAPHEGNTASAGAHTAAGAAAGTTT